jgi:hypothetical protein
MRHYCQFTGVVLLVVSLWLLGPGRATVASARRRSARGNATIPPA